VWFQNARAKHRRALLKHGLSEQQEQRHPQTHQHQPFYQQQNSLAAAGSGSGTLLQSTTSATITHQLTANPVDDRISGFSLYENTMCDYSSRVTK